MQATFNWRGARLSLVWFFEKLGPVRTVIIASLLLSAFAVWGKINPNNDGMLYVEAAQLFKQGGLSAALQVYDWLFLSVLIAGLSTITGLHEETAAYVLSAFMLAGLGAVIVACTRMLYRPASWMAVVVVLALPALNEYRDFIIREHGAWLFVFLSLWLLMLWERYRSWPLAIASQLCVIVAFLFRPEAFVFLAVPFVWMLFRLHEDGAFKRVGQLMVLPVAGALMLGLVALVGGELELASKVERQLRAVNIAAQVQDFHEVAEHVAEPLSRHLSDTDARRLLFYGLLSLIVVKFVTNLCLFVVPLVRTALVRRDWGAGNHASGPLRWAFVIYALVLVAFVLEAHWLSSRFVVMLNLLAVPLLAYATYLLWQAWPRWRWLVGLIIVLTAIANVVSTSAPKERHPAAAEWIKQQNFDSERIYFDSGVVSYLAEMGYRNHPSRAMRRDRGLLEQRLSEGGLDLIVMEGREADSHMEQWAKEHELQLLQTFSDKRGRAIYIYQVPHSSDQ